MSKFCKNCGAPLDETALFCANCGTKVEEIPMEEAIAEEPKAAEAPKYEEAPKVEEVPRYEEPKARDIRGIVPRSIPLAVVLSIITCGIYGIYWMYMLNEEMNRLAGDEKAASGGMVILFDIITCGIYGLYWCYKMGEKVDEIKGENASSKILYLVLALVGFAIVDFALMQDAINKEVA